MKDLSSRRSELLLHIARLHYERNLSKTAIKNKLGKSKSGKRWSVTEVARLLDEAHDSGIVRIEIKAPQNDGLVRSLIAKYSCLREAIVVASEDEYLQHTRTLAKAAAEYFDDNVCKRAGTRVGLSGGLTIFELVKTLPEKNRKIKLYPTAILGRGSTIVNHIDPIVSLMILWAKSGYPRNGLFFVTCTPPEKKPGGRSLSVSDMQRELDQLLQRRKIHQIHDDMRKVDFLFASARQIEVPVGRKSRMGAMSVDLLQDIGISQEHVAGAVGDVNYSFIDDRGQTRPEWRLFLSLQADVLRKMAADASKRVILIGGHNKEKILRAALIGKLFNVLITDERTATALLK